LTDAVIVLAVALCATVLFVRVDALVPYLKYQLHVEPAGASHEPVAFNVADVAVMLVALRVDPLVQPVSRSENQTSTNELVQIRV
jgi:hypothetical protein